MSIIFQGQVTRKLGVKKYVIEYLFASGRLDPKEFPVVAGRRMYSEGDLSKIRAALKTVRQHKTNNKGKEAECTAHMTN
jgi:DNA-binding transcriptional MerR regulator